MSVPLLDSPRRSVFRLQESLRWWDPDTRCTVIVSQPGTDPDLWSEYVRGAKRSYRTHGVERALDLDATQSRHNTSLFFAAVDEAGHVVGGVRATAPLRSADESHAIVEWADQPGLAAVRKMITDRLPFGVVEMKSAWATSEPERSRLLTETLARTAYPTMTLLDVQFLMATAATHVLERWRSSGGVVASKIPATPYPDDRYRTKMMWWDRSTFVNFAEPKQASKIVSEMIELTDLLDSRREVVRRGSGS